MQFVDYVKTIQQPRISIIASGPSVNKLTDDELNLIKEKSYLMTINYAPLKINGNLNFWSDIVVSEALYDYWYEKGNPKPTDMVLVTRERSFPRTGKCMILRDMITAWFDKTSDQLQGNYTIVWLLMMLQRAVPEKEIYIFGLDMTVDAKQPNVQKWYDAQTNADRNHRGASYPINEKLEECRQHLNQFVKPNNIWNCNPDSGYKGFPFCNWKEVFK